MSKSPQPFAVNETAPRFDVRGGLVVLFVCLIVQIIVRICQPSIGEGRVIFADVLLCFALAKSFNYCQQRLTFSFLMKTVWQGMCSIITFGFISYWMIFISVGVAPPMYYLLEQGIQIVIFCWWVIYFRSKFQGYWRQNLPVLLMGMAILGYLITFNHFSYPSEANFQRNFPKYTAVVQMIDSGELKLGKYYPVSRDGKTYQRARLNLPCEYSYLNTCNSYVEKLDNVTEIYFCTMNSIDIIFSGFVYRSDDYDLTLNNAPGGVYGYQYKKLGEHWFFLNYER